MKKLIALALTAVFAVSLVGCGTTAESSSLLDDDFEETTEVETTEVPTTFQKTTTMSPAEREATYKELCDEYDYDDVFLLLTDTKVCTVNLQVQFLPFVKMTELGSC